jgi:hypothetical protein
MSINTTPNQLAALEEQLLSKVRERGGHAGNVTLLRELRWQDDQYWSIRDRLLDSGHLQLGRGKGGSVSLVTSNEPEAVVPPSQDTAALLRTITSEASLYEPVAEVLRKEWSRYMRFREHVVEVTAKQGRRDTGGTWTRPDIVVAALRSFPYVPGKFFDLITFELKSIEGMDVTGVFEALAHRRAATQSYVWLHVPTESSTQEDVSALTERIADEARRHGIGLIVAADPSDYSSWDIQLRAIRVEPDPEFLNEFVAQQLSQLAREELALWFR